MSLPNNSNVVTYTFGNGSLVLQSSFHRLKKLTKATGTDAILFLNDALTFGMNNDDERGVFEGADNIVTVLYHLQAGSEMYSEEQIYDWLFGNLLGFFTEENIKELARVLMLVMGKDIADELRKISEAKAEGDSTQKKEVASDQAVSLGATS